MRFLIHSKSREAAPPEMMIPMIGAMRTWMSTHGESGKLVDFWGYAGLPAGGGILEVDSHEELDAIMGSFPFGQFSDIEVYALSDINAGLDSFEQNIAQMMEAMG